MTSLAIASPMPGTMNRHLAAHKSRAEPHVWLATMADLPALLALGRAMHAESRYAFLPFHEPSVAATAAAMIGRGLGYVALAADEPDAPAWGFIAGSTAGYFFCPLRYAVDLALYVAPQRRGSWTAVQALRAFYTGFRSWAKLAGCVEVALGTSTGVHPAATARLYERLGLTPVGTLFKERLR